MDTNFGEADRIDDQQVKHIVDLGYQCKLCYPICPYVPPHEWEIDFPRVLMRANLVTAKQEGVSFADKVFGDTDSVGRLASLAAPLANCANRNPVVRGLMEKHFG